MSKQQIQEYSQAIKIPYLLHFTRASNLPSILEHGLYPMSRIGEIGVAPAINDELRLDGHLDGLSLSIAFPNYRMFYKLRKDNPDVEWVVLAVEQSVLWLKDCAFCRHNAADARIIYEPIEELKKPEALVGMFEAIDGEQSREDQKLKPYDPTDGQAEILVFDVIEPNLIGAAIFEKNATRDTYQGLLGSREVFVHPKDKGVFASRSYVRSR